MERTIASRFAGSYSGSNNDIPSVQKFEEKQVVGCLFSL
jgi:hypothetical protein